MALKQLILVFIILNICVAENYFADTGKLVNLDSEKFVNVTGIDGRSKFTQDWFILFYAPWCGHCKALAKKWETLGIESQTTNIGAVNCDDNTELKQRFEIRGYPTVLFFSAKTQKMYKFNQNRTVEDLKNFTENYATLAESALEIPKTKSQIMGFIDQIGILPLALAFSAIIVIIIICIFSLDEKKKNKTTNQETAQTESNLQSSQTSNPDQNASSVRSDKKRD